ncbi:MAG: MMPL family transporter [Aliidongia sp.]
MTSGQADLDPFRPALTAFHRTMADSLAGKPQALSWTKLLGGQLGDLAGSSRFVLVQPKLDFGALQPGGAAAARLRELIAGLPLVASGEARVRVTGSVALADDEFATVAQGMVAGLAASIVLISLWLFLAVRSWRLIVPILLTLGIGLMLTLLFATLAVGTLNLVSVGFGILFVGLAVDFAIQFVVRYREVRHELPDPAAALVATARQTGGQILVASSATAAGFLAFVPTSFEGVAELGLIAGIGMLIAFLCTFSFLRPRSACSVRPASRARSVSAGPHRSMPPSGAATGQCSPVSCCLAQPASCCCRSSASTPIHCTPRIRRPRQCGRFTTSWRRRRQIRSRSMSWFRASPTSRRSRSRSQPCRPWRMYSRSTASCRPTRRPSWR